MIYTSDFLDFLVSPGATPSNLGAQLERLRDGTTGIQDPHRARDNVEASMIAQAQLIRCIDEFEARPILSPRGQAIEKINRYTKIPEGKIALGALRAYHSWASKSQERGLVEVYRYLAKIAPTAVPKPPADCDDLVQAFRDGSAKRCRFQAAEVYADALIAVQTHTRIFNEKNRD